MITIKSSFIAVYKLGDNIVVNLTTLNLLYDAYNAGDDEAKNHLRKPMITTIVFVIEAVLYDFYYRARKFTAEGITNFTTEQLDAMLSSKKDQFEDLIKKAQRAKVLTDTHNFYENLHTLRKLRNRVHIQNSHGQRPVDELEAFTEKKLVLAERALERILKVLLEKHSRGDDMNFVQDFILPWEAHYRDVRESVTIT